MSATASTEVISRASGEQFKAEGELRVVAFYNSLHDCSNFGQPLGYGVIKTNGFTIVSVEINSEYKIIEPEVPEQILNELKEYGKKLKKEEFVFKKIKKLCKKFEIPYSDELAFKIKYYTDREFSFGALEPLMQDKNVSAIICDMYNEPVSIIYNGRKMKTNLIFDKNELPVIVNLLATYCDKKLSKKEPMLDKMIDGTRIQLFYGSDFVSPKFIIVKPSLNSR